MDKLEVGQTVELTWVDSGIYAERTGIQAHELSCSKLTNYGTIMSIHDDCVVLGMSVTTKAPGSDPHNEVLWGIWIPAITEAKVLSPRPGKRSGKQRQG